MKFLGYLFVIISIPIAPLGGLALIYGMQSSMDDGLSNTFGVFYILLPLAVLLMGLVFFTIGYRLIYGENPFISELNYLGLDKIKQKAIMTDSLEVDLGHGIHHVFKIFPLIIGADFLLIFSKTLSLVDLFFGLWFVLLGVLLFRVRRMGYFNKYDQVWSFAFCFGKRIIAQLSFKEPAIYKIYLDYTDYKRRKRKFTPGDNAENRLYEAELSTSKGYLVLFSDQDRFLVEDKVKQLSAYYSS